MKTHEKRFIIEFYGEAEKKWIRSSNVGFEKFFSTREEALAVLNAPEYKLSIEGMKYHVRQK